MQTFCAAKGVQGAHVFTKLDVNGPDTRPVYQTVRALTGLGKVKWNFMGKFIVDKQGNVTLPASDEEVVSTVQSLL